jgi:chromatin remodeling complex protein RSC6
MSKVTSKPSTNKPKAVKVSKPKETEPVEVIETVASQEAVTTEVTTTEVSTMRQRFESIIKLRQEQLIDIKREIQDLRKMQRDHEHAIKEASKKSKKKKLPRDENNPRKPSGFASPVVVSDELYSFLESFGIKKGDPIARTDVTRFITQYIKEKDLQNQDYRREILPDAVLGKLFGPAIEHKIPEDESSPLVYTYLRLQKYLSQHFPKKKAVAA